jgi:triacylglycerol lipase
LNTLKRYSDTLFVWGENLMLPYVFNADFSKFNAFTTRYSGENALVLADCAKLAYKAENIIQEALQVTWKFKNFEFFSGKSTQAFVVGNDSVIIVAFRGTEGKIADIVADAKVKPTIGPVGMVHQGFNDALHEVWGQHAAKDIRATIKKFQDNKQTIWFCGHSLGAALATLAAVEYVVNDKGVINGLYTIGQPRLGNTTFTEYSDKILANKYFRFVNNDDIVPRIPLPNLVFNYAHAGIELYIDSAGKLHDVMPWWKKTWDRLKGIADDIGEAGLADLKDHGSENYVALIRKNRAISTRWS